MSPGNRAIDAIMNATQDDSEPAPRSFQHETTKGWLWYIWQYICAVRTGGLYLHYKGGVYRMLYTAHESTNARTSPWRLVIVYRSLKYGTVHTRDWEEWNGWVNLEDGLRVRRFAKVTRHRVR